MKMASSALLPILLLLAFLATTGSARPCKTIFYFSTTTTTYYPLNSHSANPNSPNSLLLNRNPRYITLIFTTTTRLGEFRPSFSFNSIPAVNGGDSQSSSSAVMSSGLPLRLYSSVSSSFRERSKDIMSVVGALLFGVGCGALTAATMFIVWALCSPRSFDFEEVSDDDDDDDDDTDDVAASKKKLGYVAIPSDAKVADDDLKKPAPPANEVV